MSEPIRVNLLRTICLKTGQRRWCYRAIILYLLLWSGLLVGSIHYATMRACQLRALKEKADAAEARFQVLQPGDSGIVEEVKGLQSRLGKTQGQAEKISRLARSRIDVPRIFMNLLEPLPDEALILSLSIKPRSEIFRFELASPDVEGKPSIETLALLKTWAGNAYLDQVFERIEQVDSRSYDMTEEPLTVFTFSGILKEKG